MTCESKPMSFRPVPYSFYDVESTLVDGVCTLTDVVITNPVQIDLISWATLSCGVVAIVVVHAKDGLYCNQFPTNMFFSF